MKIRRDIVAVSSILFTFALLIPAPAMWNVAVTVRENGPWVSGPLYRFQDCFAPTGLASLAVIAIGLIVTWAGYIKGVRWTWFVMFVIVWVWAFPVLMLPLHPWTDMALFAPTLASALKESGMARSAMEVILAFLLMVLALILPVKTFILGRGGGPNSG